MTFILDVTIGLGIWVPFTLGKTTALLSVCPTALRRAINSLMRP